MRLYNTLTGRKEPLEPLESGHVRMYTCGPTVYNFAHIGNFRTFASQDLLRRWIRYRGFKLTHVMNVTDVDDKTIANAREQGVSLTEYTERYSHAFFEDCRTLKLQSPEIIAYATHHIPEMVALVEKLFERGLAYRQEGSIYFKIAAFPPYGRLARIDPEQLDIGHSVEADEYSKDNPRDFVLWKEGRDGDASWDTAIGAGRPGWHLECSAMSMKYLGESFDIHGGGVDLVFPHHENEIAQSEGSTGKPFVKYWFHTEHLVVDGEKMSKSKGNFYTLRDLVEKGYDPLAIRYLLLSTHYRKPLNFTLDGIRNAGAALDTLRNFILLARTCPAAPDNPRVREILDQAVSGFEAALDDDLNVSGALGALFEARYALNALAESQGLSERDRDLILQTFEKLNQPLDIIDFSDHAMTDSEIAAMIEARSQARLRRDFREADNIREQLLSRGIVLEDTRDGVRWKRR